LLDIHAWPTFDDPMAITIPHVNRLNPLSIAFEMQLHSRTINLNSFKVYFHFEMLQVGPCRNTSIWNQIRGEHQSK
jgi:hypothetical protein